MPDSKKLGETTTLTRLYDNYGFSVEATPMDELRTISPVRLVGSIFTGTTIDSNFWTETNANNGDSSQANASLILETKTTANGSTIIQSVRRARYNGGSSNRFRGQIRLGDAGASGNVRRWGMFDGTDGAYFKLSGTTLSVCTMRDSAESSVSSDDWNNNKSTPTLTNINTYEIYITNAKVYFIIGGVLKHTASFATSTWTSTVNLPVRLDNTNSGGVDVNYALYCRAATIYRLGELMTQPISKYQSGTTAGLVLKYGAGNLHALVISGVVNNSVVTLYDNTAASGTIIWASGSMGAQTTPFSLDFHLLPFSTGLTLVIATANCNATVIYE